MGDQDPDDEFGLTAEQRAAFEAMPPDQRHAMSDYLHRARAFTAEFRDLFRDCGRRLDNLAQRLGETLPQQPNQDAREQLLDLLMAINLQAETAHAIARDDMAAKDAHQQGASHYLERFNERVNRGPG
ncbi:hypothetical protein [Goodfellowiella coeruleoviolacea]|uniref:Uncharacterized protein n=1 Tax=Goodfellowiella coeruleoviolacea TaxID=334858 RepID=A0AAE3GN26_9PSEU|nr:hypothetical protein [Goodfellowiella coeruleoviolacea]MCP2169018.1 hypothetical protein [Goodfellowiella coeruleoviolacea]